MFRLRSECDVDALVAWHDAHPPRLLARLRFWLWRRWKEKPR